MIRWVVTTALYARAENRSATLTGILAKSFFVPLAVAMLLRGCHRRGTRAT